ncbi:MAG: hypothetical protein IJ437_06020 [Clostridia bacterium]|nr:hypothetical protein [Clostridia bacterium]
MIIKELEKRNVPDFFSVNGEKIDSLAKWEEYKDSLFTLITNEEYGIIDKKITPTIAIENGEHSFGGKVTWETVNFTFENDGKCHTVKTHLLLPKGKENVPVFLNIGFGEEIPNKYLPLEEIIDNGFGVFYFCYKDVTSDDGDFENGLASIFEGGGEKYGKLALWSYMASACMDYLMTRSEVDTKNVAIIGHSRLGKTAILTSARDPRFILTCANESGCCGASLSRGKVRGNETIVAITDTFPFWFKKCYLKYRDNEEALPFDQHMLLSLIAPRYLVVGGAEKDFWADNDGQFLACHLASYAWELYGKNGLISNGALPNETDILLDGDACFYMRKGEHFLSRYDWNVYMTKFKEIINNDTEK